ncbi:MAG: hypothetical protein ACXQTS_02500 [Candidatus Methanospirareceae archaeon]
MLSSPYLHELFKACLCYDGEEVRRCLRERYDWKLLSEWGLEGAYLEVPFRRFRRGDMRQADVIWLLRRVNRDGYLLRAVVVHEIKTGNFEVNDVCGRYEGRYAVSKSKRGTRFLWIWGWEEVIEGQQLDERFASRVRYGGYIKLVPLDIIFPIVKRRLREIGFKEGGA